MRHLLTDVKVRKAKAAAAGKRYDLWDALVPGLSLRITDRGAKTWTVLGRLHGRVLRATVGAYPDLGVQAARTKARDALEALANGHDPRRQKAASIVTVEKALEDYMALRKDSWGKGYDSNVRSAVKLHINPAIGRLPLHEVTRRDLFALLSGIAKKHPGLANSVRGHLSGLFSWAVDAEMIETSPCANLKLPAERRQRDRVYSDPEIRAIWSAATVLAWPYGPFVKFLLVTAQRRGQVRDLEWSQIDEARNVWTSYTKEKRLHPIPLSELAREILAAAPKRGAFVFSVEGKRGVTNHTYLARKIRDSENVPKDFRVHDLRRTAATRMAELGISPWIVDAVLDHVAGGVTGVYQRYGYVEEMRHALSVWSARLREILATN